MDENTQARDHIIEQEQTIAGQERRIAEIEKQIKAEEDAETILKTIAKNSELKAQLAALTEAARAVVETTRGSGGINPDAAAALLKLAALIQESK